MWLLWVGLSHTKPGNPVACSVINSRRSLAAPEKDLGRSGRYPLRLSGLRHAFLFPRSQVNRPFPSKNAGRRRRPPSAGLVYGRGWVAASSPRHQRPLAPSKGGVDMPYRCIPHYPNATKGNIRRPETAEQLKQYTSDSTALTAVRDPPSSPSRPRVSALQVRLC